MLSESHWYWTQDPLTAKKVVESQDYQKVDVAIVIKLLIRSKKLYEAMHDMKQLLQIVIKQENEIKNINEKSLKLMVRTSRKIQQF